MLAGRVINESKLMGKRPTSGRNKNECTENEREIVVVSKRRKHESVVGGSRRLYHLCEGPRENLGWGK